MTDKPKYYLSLDIEGEGDRFNNSIIAIGACVGPAEGSWNREHLLKFRGNLKPLPGDTPDPKTISEFWDRFPDVYKEIKDGAEDAATVMGKLLFFCQSVVAIIEDNPHINGKIEIITDCPDYDLGRLHYLGEIATKTWPTPIRNLGKEGRRHGQVDPGERLDALGEWDACQKWIETNHPGVVHDHRPDNDATHSYYQMIYLNQKQVQN